MSILVLGAGGQVGREIAGRLGEADHALTHSALDITRPDAIARALDRHHPKVLINAAAYTAVDRAEAEPDRAEAINRDGAAHLATACAQRGIALLHLSTDYVFDGRADAPYTPADAVNPLGQYGRSKAAGEAAIRQALPAHLILRTSWVFGRHGGNFVKTMLRLARDRDALNIVDDQIGGPPPLPRPCWGLPGRSSRGAPGPGALITTPARRRCRGAALPTSFLPRRCRRA